MARSIGASGGRRSSQYALSREEFVVKEFIAFPWPSLLNKSLEDLRILIGVHQVVQATFLTQERVHLPALCHA
jgi:hypothetical protein